MLEQRNKGVVVGILLMMHRGLSGQEEICSQFFTTWEEADKLMTTHWDEWVEKDLKWYERWGHDIYTVIMTDEGIEFDLGAGPDTIIGEVNYAYGCSDCGRTIWSSRDRAKDASCHICTEKMYQKY